MKRLDYVSWDSYFMGIASLSAKRSKDPKTQVGACIVSKEKTIVGIGYNGFPRGISDDAFPWNDTGDFLDTKYPYVVHAEANALLNATASLDQSTLYVTLFPCNECTKLIIQSGIKHIKYLSNKDFDKPFHVASKKMLEHAGISFEHIEIEPLQLP
jgi:dCMP deaminase